MADAHSNYHDYLLGRSQLGFLYRKWRLFPVVSRYVTGKTLDYGCGIGDFLQFRPATIGVDINEENITYCQSLGLPAYTMDGGRIPFNDSFFDSIVMDNVLEHIALDQVDGVMKEVLRVLGQRGTILIGVPGLKGYEADEDHKHFYLERDLITLLECYDCRKVKSFHMPIYMPWLGKYLKQYCVYVVFEKL